MDLVEDYFANPIVADPPDPTQNIEKKKGRTFQLHLFHRHSRNKNVDDSKKMDRPMMTKIPKTGMGGDEAAEGRRLWRDKFGFGIFANPMKSCEGSQVGTHFIERWDDVIIELLLSSSLFELVVKTEDLLPVESCDM